MRENEDSEAEDLMWGTPGTLVAARAMLEEPVTSAGARRGRRGAEALWSRRDAEGYWTQRLYGEEHKGLNTAHGLVGNVQALRPLLDAERRAQLERDTNALLERVGVPRGRTRELAVRRTARAGVGGRRDPAAVVLRCSGNRDRGRRVSG